AIGVRKSRRVAASMLGGLAALPAIGLLNADAKKKKKKRKKKKRKKSCTPQCGATCGGADGCGGTCACTSGSTCEGGACQPCDVVHTGDDVASAAALNARLAQGGTIRICPGRYQGRFKVRDGQVIGAGDGADPASNTILDAAGTAQPAGFEAVVAAGLPGKTTHLSQVRITGGSGQTSVGLLAEENSNTVYDALTVTGNPQGLIAQGNFTLRNSIISNNIATDPSADGAGVALFAPQTSVIENCSITGNQVLNGNGGGIFASLGTLTINGTEISGNTTGAGGSGGGLFVASGSVFIDSGSRVTGNTAGNGGGGGIYRDGGTVTLFGASVLGNQPNQCFNATCGSD
ncbi:MAG: hypothetical protein QM692_14610, partial [Thermomicrobiales bacterium]